jgi:hypothetical protein
MGELRMNTRNTYLGLAFVAASSAALYGLSNDNSAEQNSYIACSSNILIPQTLEQAEYLEAHAAEAYARLDPITKEDLEKSVEMFSDGQAYEITGMDGSSTTTRPDGTTTVTPCVSYRLIP